MVIFILILLSCSTRTNSYAPRGTSPRMHAIKSNPIFNTICGDFAPSVFVPVNGLKLSAQQQRSWYVNRLMQPSSSPRATNPQLQMTSRCDLYSDVVKRPRWGGPFGMIVRYLNQVFVGSIFAFIVRVLNKFKAHRLNTLTDLVWNRSEKRGLLTVSNHLSVMDDPGLFAACLPWWCLPNSKFRWTICTEDVFFANPFVQKLLGAGNGLPLDRSGSLEQPMFQRFQEKLDGGNWCHIFPEGRVWQRWRYNDTDTHLGKFKFGVGKLIAHCKNQPIVVPFFHKGMDMVVPEKVTTNLKKPSVPISIVPRGGQEVTIWVGEPIDFTEKVAKFNEKHPGILNGWSSTTESLELYSDITKDIYAAVKKLEDEAWPKPKP